MTAIAFTLRRIMEDDHAMLGALRDREHNPLCLTLEPPWRENAPRVSCIPPGVYRLGLRTVGGWHAKLLEQFGAKFHKGAIELLDVPGRSAILFHPLNYHTQTDGCIGPGRTRMKGPDGALAVGNSVVAYRAVYPGMAQAAMDGERIQVLDLVSRTHAGTVV